MVEETVDGVMAHVMLKNSVSSDRYQLILTTENHVGDDKVFVLPTLTCHKVLRQQGQIGIVKAANVEIHEVSRAGVIVSEPTELSEFLRSHSGKNVLMAYTFLSPEYEIVVQKERHETTSTLDSSIEHGYLQILISEDHSLNKAIFRITNSNRQYLRVSLPKNIKAIWSVHVANEPVKPARDVNGILLIPLTSIMSTTGTGNSEWHSVELVYLTSHMALGANGTFEQELFSVDVPINLFSVEVLFPEHLSANITASGLRKVYEFSSNLPQVTQKKTTSRNVAKKGAKSYYGSESYSQQASVLYDWSEETLGNVKVEIPQLGIRQKFEKLLVLGNNNFQIKAEYPWPPPRVYPFWLRIWKLIF
eukprot:TRINITY_DN2700_c0_g1_i14.p1 TRINITY_DN2700_c0_g1~~TRINITY_DN2700_c0_g1_i14.p1  ORF type:complete len:362 (+),score=73.72 TRINITY_DN2700_c0_g1_i14:1284-2369(+)